MSSGGGSRVSSIQPEVEIGNGQGSPQNLSSSHQQGEAVSHVASDNLTYSGTSIFFGGPLSVPVSGSRNDNTSSSVPDSVNTRGRASGSNAAPVPEHSVQEVNAPVRGSMVRNQSPVFAPTRVSHNNPSH